MPSTRVTELIPGEKVVWRILGNHFSFIGDRGEWKDTEMRFQLSESESRTEVLFMVTWKSGRALFPGPADAGHQPATATR